MAKLPSFRPDLFAFLAELKENNTREWFGANKGRYEASVRDPLLAFIAAFKPRLAKISGHFVADKALSAPAQAVAESCGSCGRRG